MRNARICALVALWLAGCQLDEVQTATVEQHGMNMQGMNMQGMNMQGMNMQGMNMQGMNMQGATLGGIGLANVRVDKGELVAERDGVTLRGSALVGARFTARVVSTSDPSLAADVEYRITAVTAESSAYDPTRSGATYLYTLEQYVAETGTWAPACDADTDGRRAAIPMTGTWNARGDRVESSSLFTFACTSGVIAKCYRWGYRPWLTGYGDLVSMHWSCTRMARADYCGNGVPHTRDGTWINVWDTLPAPGPIQKHGLLPPLGMIFEAGWSPRGAVCLSRARWLLDDTLAQLCPDRLVPPGLLGGTVCDTVAEVLGYDADTKLFNESYLLNL